MGNLLQLSPTSIHSTLENWARIHGDFYCLKIFSRHALVVSDSAAIADILRARPDTFRRFSSIESVFGEMGIASVLSAEGEQWRQQRKLTTRAFDPAHLRSYFPRLVSITERLRQHWLRAAQQAKPVDIQADLMSYAIDVIAGLAFGSDVNTIDTPEHVLRRQLNAIFPIVNRRLNTPLPYWRYVKLRADRALDKNLRELRGAVHKFISDARQRMQINPWLRQQPGNFIEAFVAERDQPESAFTDDDVYGNVFATLLVGADSTANVFAWITYFLAEDPRLQQAAKMEADAVLGDQPVLENFSGLASLCYADALAQEAMRLKPSGPILFLESNADVVVQQIAVPRGTPVLALTRCGGLDAHAFAQPERFDPSRWLGSEADNSKGCASPNELACLKRKVMPFGAGARLCPGRYLALLQIKMLASMLCKNFIVERVGDEPVEERFQFSMEPVNLRVRLVRR